jgi:uncharacterized protein involved in exopolysaccharide biosynthesis
VEQATEATERLSPQAAPADIRGSTGPGLFDSVLVLLEHWKLLLWLPLLAGTAALAMTFAIKPSFTSTARLLVPQQSSGGAGILMQQLGSIGGLASAAAGLKNPSDQYVGLLSSRTIADTLIERFKLKEVYDVELQDEARLKLDDHTALSAGVKDGIISVSVDDHDPERAADMANAYVDELRRMVSTAALTEASQRRQFFQGELRRVQEQLIRAELALKSSGVSAATLRIEPRAALEELARLRAAVSAAEIGVASARGMMADSNPVLQQALRELQALRGQLAQAERAPSRANDGVNEDYLSLYRDFKYQSALFEMVAKQYEFARLDEVNEGIRVQVVDKAVAADRKSSPKRALIAAAVSVMAFLALATWLLLRERLKADRSPVAAMRMHRLRAVFRRDGSR